jgi:hypothetical protein
MKESFFAHQTILEANSEYFRTALKKDWVEGQQCIVTLDEVYPPDFHLYAQYLYTGTIFSKVKDGEFGSTNFSTLGRLYGLGERLLDRTFQNRVIDAIVAGTRERRTGPDGTTRRQYPANAADIIYSSTAAGSPARKLIVDFFVTNGHAGWVEHFDFGSANVEAQFEFLKDVSAALLDKRKRPSVTDKYWELRNGKPTSYYHGVSKQERGKEHTDEGLESEKNDEKQSIVAGESAAWKK